jgi:hypothetical protein
MMDIFAVPNLPPALTTHTVGRKTPAGVEYPDVHLPAQWLGPQYPAFVTYLRDLLAGSGLTARPAQLFTAHCARETGFGQNIFCNCFANIKEVGSDPWYRLRSDGLAYSAYESPRAGIEAAIAKLRDSPRYQDAWTMLMASNVKWYSRLGLSGYYQFRKSNGAIVDTTLDNVRVAQASYERSLGTVERHWADQRVAD